jgi:putative addiction module CopG family antidote
MSVILSPQAETLIRQEVAAGPYRSADEVIQEVLRLLDARDRHAQELRDSVAEGFAAIGRGEGIELTPELMEELSRQAEERARRGEQPHPDVCP